MKKIYSLISLPALLMVSSCSDKNEPMVPQTVPGEDVVFQASLPMNTRTSYGPLGTSSRPVYWTNGDLIQVASPQCANGFNNATYQVEVTSGSEVQNYADKLVHHDPTGVRWGTADPSEYRFFAMYPQCPMTINGSDMEAAVYFDPVQSSTMVKDGTKWTPSSYDMENNIMYAQPISNGDGTVKPQVTTDSEGNTVANLQFNPFSTVLHLNFAGWSTDNTAETEGFTVFSVTLKSPATTPIAGNFPLKLHSDGSLPVIGDAVASTSSSSIKLSLNQGNNMNGFTPSADETFECDFFMAPRANNANGVMNIGTGWSLEIETSAGNWSFDLGQATTAGSSLGLEPGQIHVLNIPELKIDKGWVYNPDSWLAEIPDNVYWSEVSLPGSWYSASNGSDKYQYGTIAQQFAAGVRAFHLETKSGYTSQSSERRNVVISGTGRTASTNLGGVGKGAYVDATPIASTVNEIASQLTSESEFAVLTLSYADGGKGGVSDKDFADWLELVTNTFDSSKSTSGGWFNTKYFEAISASTQAKLFSGKLDVNTPVSALRGKLLVILNVQKRNTSPTNYAAGNFLYAYTEADWTQTASLVSQAHWANWSNDYLTLASGNAWESNPQNGYFNFTFANRTQLDSGTATGLPTYAQRKAAIESIITRSKEMRGDGRHNILFLIGAGGTEAVASTGDETGNGPTLVANQLNEYLLGVINKKVNDGDASPLGLVYTNFTTGTSGQQVVDAIIRMNRRFKLLEIGGTTPSNPGTQTDAPVKSVSSTHSSGFSVDKNGWTVF